MRLNSKGQVTIPAMLRERHDLRAGDEVEVVDDGGILRIVQASVGETRGERLVERMRGKATTALSTDQLLGLLRED
ncbi:MAG: AbrB/MazE/SpoVT family DNA-binding domain-containing protein [Acidimicrobiales bacterium]